MSSAEPIICFGQQPCGFFPRRFLWAKMQTARRLREEIGGRIVFFFHDSDHDPRETITMLRDRSTGKMQSCNFSFDGKLQKKYVPLYLKRMIPGWQENMARQLPCYVERPLAERFAEVRAENVADFCLECYQRFGLLDGIDVVRSSDPSVREMACSIEDYFVDIPYENEIVRARFADQRILLHQGGASYLELPQTEIRKSQISPTRDTRLRWMQSVIRCSHYIAGAGEMAYLNQSEAPEIQFIARDEIERSSEAYVDIPI